MTASEVIAAMDMPAVWRDMRTAYDAAFAFCRPTVPIISYPFSRPGTVKSGVIFRSGGASGLPVPTVVEEGMPYPDAVMPGTPALLALQLVLVARRLAEIRRKKIEEAMETIPPRPRSLYILEAWGIELVIATTGNALKVHERYSVEWLTDDEARQMAQESK